MVDISKLAEQLREGRFDSVLSPLYVTPSEVEVQRTRYEKATARFAEIFGGDRQVSLFSAPGRTEVGGNHTDHNHGRVLAASVNLDVIAVVARNEDSVIRIQSEGYLMDTVHLSDLSPQTNEVGKSRSLIRGICARIRELGYEIGGFDAYTTSAVLKGSGLSSSAAFEVLVGTILNHLFCEGAIDAVRIAQIAQYAENAYFGKPCGLMDQTASSVGSFVTIDFLDPEHPVIETVQFDFSACEHALCIVDTGGNHADLTEDYASVRREMEAVAAFLGQKALRDVEQADFLAAIPALRKELGDRAILRAIHFFGDNARVLAEVEALNQGDFETFKQHIIASGLSSYQYNQNVYTCKNPSEQGLSLALALSQQILEGRGAWRVHGGGFAGTIQAFVPQDLLHTYQRRMEEVFGPGSCYILSIRPVGGVKVL